jgi:hypothetical protein
MARRNTAQIQFDALSLEGAILPPEWLGRVAALEAPAQSAADYGIPKGLQLRDEIGRYWRVAQAIWGDFVVAGSGNDADGAARRLTREMLTQVFGFADLAAAGERNAGGRVFPLAFEALGGRVPVVVGPPTESLDQNAVQHGDGSRRRSAWGALQEYLNAADGALWGFATNGLCVRLGRDNASLTRPAWLEADLERIFTEERFADFSVLWLLFHASRFGRAGQPVQEAPLEQWREAGRQEGSRAREALSVGVEDALRSLGQGFLAHPENSPLREALATGALAPADYFNELLRLVYRMIFLLTVEERGILHRADADPDAVALYGEGYGMRRLRERSVRYAAHDRHADLWTSLRPVLAALGNPDGESALALPGLGGLFGADQCPHLDASSLENRALLTAVYRLAWLREGKALARVNWKDMGVEEFGSVYESLLELVPVVSDGGRKFGYAGEGESAGNARKLTGSYYTPDALVQQLLDTALEPVVAQRLAENPTPVDAERAMLSLSVVDPACGSGHFLLAAARRLAGHLARLRAGGTPGAAEYRHALRDVVTHCIHGVDRNPMALELARMALWLEAYTPDRALGFLDHHLVCGDALLGLVDLGAVKDGIPDEAFKALTGDDKDVAKLLTKLNRAGRKALEDQRRRQDFGLVLGTRSLGEAWAALDALSDDGLAGVEEKRAAYARLRAEARADPRAMAADLFVGAFLMPKTLAEGERALTEAGARARFSSTSAMVSVLDGTMSAEHTVIQSARRVCSSACVLHWPLAFPQVFSRGGFDVVLGNPPWERIKLQEQEFFAQRAPQVAEAGNKAEREAEIAKLKEAEWGSPERVVYNDFVRAKQLAEAASLFCHSEARYPLTGVGDVNTYALFAETMYRIVGPGGRLGVVLPTGIVTDDTTKQFFDEVVSSGRLVRLAAYENEALVFPGVHHAFKFCLVSIAGSRGDGAADLSFFARSPDQIHDARRHFRLSADDFRLINPNTRTCPIFRSREDAELTKKIYRVVPVLLDDSRKGQTGNPWSVSFLRMIDMATDSRLFQREPAQGSLPLYEAKFVGQFDHRRGSYSSRGGERGFRVLPDTTIEEYQDVELSITPFYWVPRSVVADRTPEDWPHQWFWGFKDVTASTNERTVLASVIPFAGVGHTMPLIFARGGATASALLLANLNTLALDYVARQKISGLHLTYGYLKQLPVLSPDAYGHAGERFVLDRVVELTYTANDLAPWARDLGYNGRPFRWDPDRRALLRAELDAWYARAYGLTRDELRYVLDPADVMGADWPSETFRVLKNNEERQFGEYRTRRLVLEAWDALVVGHPMPSTITASVLIAQSADDFTGPPAATPDAARMMTILALTRAAARPLAVVDIARAFALRAKPSELPAIAPPALTADVAAWVKVAPLDSIAAGVVHSLVDQLVDREAIQWHLAPNAPRAVGVSTHAPRWEELHPWYRREATLLLGVLAALPAAERARVDAAIPAADRERFARWSA